MNKVVLLIFLLGGLGLYGQEENELHEEQQHEHAAEHAPQVHEGAEEHQTFKHSIALMIGHAHISQGKDFAGERKFLGVPSIALDYNYSINEKWAIGWHNDIIIESFIVERHLSGGTEEELERDHPIASLVMLGYKVLPFMYVNGGAGGEFASEENFVMIRLGFEGGWHLHDPSWEFVAGINYDIKLDAYDTWNLTVGIAKRF